MNDVTRLGRCARCGAALPPDAVGDLCLNCSVLISSAPTVLAFPTGSASDAPTIAQSPAASEHPTVLASESDLPSSGPRRATPTPGEPFGPYRIERLLGRGGMGDVYEAEELEHGRRLALKVLGRRLVSAEARAQFLREGELAAAITHPHTVYIYGSEEIADAPVITMELLSGGTLKDLVARSGPLPAQSAVDLILQVIAGLDAAASAGILHRDIKPANCFIDRDGGVKVGDFGLSIATAGRQSEASGLFQGTPQFAAPEQIRGEALDVRADIYAVGATLFYLLTGQPPFDDQDLTTLVTRVKEETPREPRAMRATVPAGLSSVVTRTLAKRRDDRPSSYAELREQLTPFSSTAAEPSPLGRRLAAGLIDQVAAFLVNVPVAMVIVVAEQQNPNLRLWTALAQVLTAIAYFAITEGRYGAGLGKWALGIEVATTAGTRPGIARAAVRGLMQETAAIIGTVLPALVVGPAALTRFALENSTLASTISMGLLAVQTAIYFMAARRSNGFAALQDRATDTRVVRRGARTIDVASIVDAGTTRGVASLRRFGPFDGARQLMSLDGNVEWWSAEDRRLRRAVWIIERTTGAPPLDPATRDRHRPTRLRWLGSRREAHEAWDAFQAFDGVALGDLQPRPWREVRQWLVDLSEELDAGLAEGSIVALSTGHVWITARSGARLLDFRVPATGGRPADEATPAVTLADGQRWLAEVAKQGLGGFPVGLPMSARRFLDRLAAADFKTSAGVVSAARALTGQMDVVEPWRRATATLAPALTIAIFLLLGVVGAFVIRRAPMGVEGLAIDLKRVADLEHATSPAARAERDALETHIAATYPNSIASELTWTSSRVGNVPLSEYRLLAMNILASHPHVTPAEDAAADAVLGHTLDAERAAMASANRRAAIALSVVPTFMFVFGVGLVAASGLVSGTFSRGSLVGRLLGLAVVDGRGRQVSRVRAAVRATLAWLPAAAFVAGVWASGFTYDGTYHVESMTLVVAAFASFAFFLVGAAIAAFRPSLQDRVAGTLVVPR